MKLTVKIRRAEPYTTVDGKKPYDEWLWKLKDFRAKARVAARVDRAARGNFGSYRDLHHGVFELKEDFGPGYRVYFAIDDDEIIVLLVGGRQRISRPGYRKSQGVLDRLSLEEAKMKKKLDGLDNLMIEHLKNPEFAAEYLKENWEYQGPDKLELLLQALHRIALARGMTEVARKSGVSRRNLYKMFSKNGNPSAKTLLVVMNALGIKITIIQSSPRRKPLKINSSVQRRHG